MWRYSVKININDGCYCPVLVERAHTHRQTHSWILIWTMWSSLSLCKQKERREDEVQRGNPLFKCQAVRAILSLLLLFPLFCTSQGSDSPPSSLPRCLLCVRACGRDCVGVHVPAGGSHSWSRSCVWKDDTGPLLSLCQQNQPTGEKRNERRMHVGVKKKKKNVCKLWGGKDGNQRNEYRKMRQRRWAEHFPSFSYHNIT